MNNKILITLMAFIAAAISSSCGGNSAGNENLNQILDSTTQGNTTSDTKTTSGDVIFEDNFTTDGSPDPTKWSLCTKYIGDPNISGSYDQAYVKDGKLILKAEKINGVYKTGGIWTQKLFDFTYGKVEVRAKLNTVDGGWPAIWIIPYEDGTSVGSCEIDIMEQYDNESIFHQTVHSYYINKLGHTTSPIRHMIASYNVGEFNTFAVNWTPEKIEFSINGKVTLTYPNLHLADEATLGQWQFRKPFYLILNCSLSETKAIADAQLPATMEVDWVKVTKVQ